MNDKTISPTVPLNQILYGPPGTGKTYNTINKALSIVDPLFYNENKHDRSAITNRYKELLYNPENQKGQIGFVTFHQSMSYEDFVEGIKPLKPEKNSSVQYDVVDGIFKQMASVSFSNYEHSKKGNQGKLSFEEALKLFEEEWEQNQEMKFPLRTAGYDYTVTGFSTHSILFKKASGGQRQNISKNTLRELYYGSRSIESKEGIWIYYPSILDKLNSYKKEDQSITDAKKFVLIIDEINRGNVSQIFGELITLIEEDKRLGSGEVLEVILPYSKSKFGVPPNLYILGTMNTADRSVEALDTALRRRFSFEEMPPKPYLIKEEGSSSNGIVDNIDLVKLLETINNRIEQLLDKDHLIGHSYFMKVANELDLQHAFYNQIIPLLQEYFFGDYGKIGLILGEGFIKEKPQGSNLFAKFNYNNNSYQDRKIYRIHDYRQEPILNISNNTGSIEFNFMTAIQHLF